MAQRGVHWCEMHEDVVVAQMSEREHLSAAGRASASEYVPSPTDWSVGSFFCSKCCWSKVDRADVLHAEHSRVTGSGLRGSLSC